MTNDSRLREVALIIADDLIGICETATKVAHRTGNTFVIDRQRTASMIQGRIASLNKSNPNEHQPHAGRLLPCPFCGGEAERHDIDPMQEEYANAGGSVIQCKKCFASSAVHGDFKSNLVDSWNTRTNAETRPSGSAGFTPPASTDGRSND